MDIERERALALAHDANAEPDAVIARARLYLNFLRATRDADIVSAVEVTPEMIEEGAEQILAASYGGLDLRPCRSVVAERVYRAMRRIGLSHSVKS